MALTLGEKERNHSSFETASFKVMSRPSGYFSDVSEQRLDGNFISELLLSLLVSIDVWEQSYYYTLVIGYEALIDGEIKI